MADKLSRINISELDSWFYCRRRHSFDGVLARCSSAELATVIVELRSRASVGDLSETELGELTSLEEALAARFGPEWRGPQEAIDTLTFHGMAIQHWKSILLMLAVAISVIFLALTGSGFLEVM
ncbi:MAG: hypothetical protein CVV64_03285 [Candidatus Wallbacteria bacterium HGW-Wallbacteria-1]|jgi:hypothetical protein|uniref:Uncharacterized protein n=1 Tax=Candidatus Wallbacteria bacterium HGW-Wallbacteria-1 TaxID=2013854 RepID=A0A2N1PTQ8_9BACT|nr:MAG: hypothetical protein CVV64_03285 [Candidatus Wallbacteria bacterium HGW-Wallbacteria-1]